MGKKWQRSIKLPCLFLEKRCIYLQSAILLDEAKIREDARSVQHKALEKGHAVLKEENKTVRQLVVQIFYWSWRTSYRSGLVTMRLHAMVADIVIKLIN